MGADGDAAAPVAKTPGKFFARLERAQRGAATVCQLEFRVRLTYLLLEVGAGLAHALGMFLETLNVAQVGPLQRLQIGDWVTDVDVALIGRAYGDWLRGWRRGGHGEQPAAGRLLDNGSRYLCVPGCRKGESGNVCCTDTDMDGG